MTKKKRFKQWQQQHQQFLLSNARLRTSSLKRFPMGSSHLHQPCLIMSSAAGKRALLLN
jgi:hypothetical protein